MEEAAAVAHLLLVETGNLKPLVQEVTGLLLLFQALQLLTLVVEAVLGIRVLVVGRAVAVEDAVVLPAQETELMALSTQAVAVAVELLAPVRVAQAALES
jgi:hypothetical protein